MSPSFFRIWFRCSCCDSCCWRRPGCTEGRERVCEVWYTFSCSWWNSQSGWYPCVCSQQLRMREASQNPCSSESKAFNLLLLNSSPGTKRITVKWSVLLLSWSCSSQPYALGFISCYLYLGDEMSWVNESEGAFHYTGPIGQRPLGLTKGTGTKTPTELIVGYCRKG